MSCFRWNPDLLHYAPLLELVQDFVVDSNPEHLALVKHSAPELVKRFPQLAGYFPDKSRDTVDPTPSPDPEQDRRPIFDAFVSFGKTLLTPGQRMGYVALPPDMPDRENIWSGLTGAFVALGYTFPNALLQYALEDLERLSIDVSRLQAMRDGLVHDLRDMGYTPNIPEGTFYVLVRSPYEDDLWFTYYLEEQKIYCLPGTIFELPGCFRISLTPNEALIERALPGFAKAIEKSRQFAS